VITLRPYAPNALNVFMSPCMPAPEEGSEPAMDRMFMIFGLETHV
jgi:hypothetical protein